MTKDLNSRRSRSISSESPVVDIASEKKDRESIYGFRYRIYVELMNKNLSSVDHVNKLMYDDFDYWGLIIYVRIGLEIVGTLRLNIGFINDFSSFFINSYRLDKFHKIAIDNKKSPILCFASKLMIAPAYQGTYIIKLIMEKVHSICREKKIQFMFMGCAPGLVSFYEKMGFRRYTSNINIPEYGYIVPLVILPEDAEHLCNVDSPFIFDNKVEYSSKMSAWLAQEFPETIKFINLNLINRENYWDFLTEKFKNPPDKAITLFHGLSRTQIYRILRTATILQCQKGDAVINSDSVDEAFILLSGTLEISRQVSGYHHLISILDAGQAFINIVSGDLSTRETTVTALTDSEILVLSSNLINRIASLTEPKAILHQSS
ncbi:MAG: GNAT family N-acetyltransferase [Bacillota bacterium]